MRAIVTVVGKDRVGIIANVCNLLAKYQVNVLDISQTVLQGYFTMMKEEGIKQALDIHIQREDIFNAMHRI